MLMLSSIIWLDAETICGLSILLEIATLGDLSLLLLDLLTTLIASLMPIALKLERDLQMNFHQFLTLLWTSTAKEVSLLGMILSS